MDDLEKRVVVVDIKMPFWSMVIFIIKWIIASIPAMIVLAFIWLGIAFLFSFIGVSFDPDMFMQR